MPYIIIPKYQTKINIEPNIFLYFQKNIRKTTTYLSIFLWVDALVKAKNKSNKEAKYYTPLLPLKSLYLVAKY